VGLGAIAMITPWRAARAGAYEDLFDAIRNDDGAAVRSLMLKGVDTNSPDRQLGPALIYAASLRSLKALSALLESPLTDVNIRNRAGETALMWACLQGELDLAKRLIARGAQVNQAGWTPLHYAAIAGHLSVVQYLLERNAYIDAPSPNQSTPLMVAARQKQTTVAKYLVEAGADPSLSNEAGLTAADYFARSGESETADWMRARAAEYLKKYGTRERPVPAPSR